MCLPCEITRPLRQGTMSYPLLCSQHLSRADRGHCSDVLMEHELGSTNYGTEATDLLRCVELLRMGAQCEVPDSDLQRP